MIDIIWLVLIFILIILGIILSKYIKFKNLKILKMIKVLKNNSLSGLFMSLGTKMGVGSIITSISAILIGGSSTIIWILIFTILSSSITYYEASLGSIYKEKINDLYIGGPFFYIKNALNKKLLAVFSTILLIICYSFLFQMVQSNTISELVVLNFNINKIFLIITILLIAIPIIFFSLKELTNSMNKIVPFMCLLYIFMCLYVIIRNYYLLPNIVTDIFSDLINPKSFLIGFLIGIKRSVFLNELLIGTTSISSASSKNDKVNESFLQCFASYFLSFVISLLTAFITLMYKLGNNNVFNNYNELLNSVFYYHYGNYGIIILLIMILFLSVTTIISGYYIGLSNISYITKNKKILFIFRILFISSLLLGVIFSSNIIWKIVDIFLIILIFINIYSIISLYKRGIK